MAKKEGGISFIEVMTALKKGQYAPIYLLEGDEPYYIDAISKYIEDNVIDDAAKDFDLTVLYGADIQQIDTVINAAQRFPMMGDKSVVIVKEAQNIKNWTNLTYYIQQPQQTTILVFCYKYGTLNGNLKVVKDMKEKGVVFESQPLRYDYEVTRWITQFMNEHKLEIEPKATEMLTNYLGTDLTKIATEIEKLTQLNGITKITPEVVEKYVGISKDYNVFELLNALAYYDILKANRIVYYFANNPKDHPIQKELPSIYNFFANLMIYHYLIFGNYGERDIATTLKINPYFVKDYASAAKYYNALQTMKIIGYIREADVRSRGVGDTNASDSLHIYQELIYKIMHKI